MFKSNVISNPLASGNKLSRNDCPQSQEEQKLMAFIPYSQAMGVYTK
jgi:hypothetical protein